MGLADLRTCPRRAASRLSIPPGRDVGRFQDPGDVLHQLEAAVEGAMVDGVKCHIGPAQPPWPSPSTRPCPPPPKRRIRRTTGT